MDRALEIARARSDGLQIPTYCDCRSLDLSPVLAACSPESLARLEEPMNEPFLRVSLQFHGPAESKHIETPCALCRVISNLWQKVDSAEEVSQVEVRIYLSTSTYRQDLEDGYNSFIDFQVMDTFPIIAFAPRAPLGTPTHEGQFKEYALFTTTDTGQLVSPTTALLKAGGYFHPHNWKSWQVHLECAPDQMVNWNMIEAAFSGCQTQHSSSCGRLVRQNITRLHVIDCATRTLVPLPETTAPRSVEYATLSYVWGAVTETETILPYSRLPSDIPLVIADAISVCLQLGLRYLWVDRYCILQNDSDSKHDQIRNMNLIYKQSELTIIAAAGSGPTYGLPGVSRPRPDVPQESMLKLGRYGIVPIMSDGELAAAHARRMDLFLGSTWNSRGWTYQEAVVSRRRLIFTDLLVVYQCWELMWDERFSSLEPTTPGGVRLDPGTLLNLEGVPQFLPHGPIGFNANDFGTHASEYLGRKFTYISDQLVAFQV
ncbi:heterokaryon incompatibility protein-domain-containing protein [Podospora conica]|nr:heterokaryon incompatibility protein-domain-containing protein [Schizothecium conicum]